MSAEQTPDIERVLADARCTDLHGFMRPEGEPPCSACSSWGAHVAQVLAPVLAAAVREAKAATWDECAKEACDLGWMHEHGEQDVLERNPYRADRVAEPQHEAATSGKESEASDE